MLERLPTSRRTVLAAAGTLFVAILAGLAIAMATGHDPAIGERSAATAQRSAPADGMPRGGDGSWGDARPGDDDDAWYGGGESDGPGGDGPARGGQGLPAGPPLQSGTS